MCLVVLTVTYQNDVAGDSPLANASISLLLFRRDGPSLANLSVDDIFGGGRRRRVPSVPVVIPQWIFETGSPQLSSGEESVILDWEGSGERRAEEIFDMMDHPENILYVSLNKKKVLKETKKKQ